MITIRLPDHSFAMEIPDDWWSAAGMAGFVPTRSAYRDRPDDNASLPRIMLPLASIWVQARALGVADFGRDRMISVPLVCKLVYNFDPACTGWSWTAIEENASFIGHF